MTTALSAAEKTALEQAEKEATALKARKRSFAKIQALYDVGPPPPTHLLIRGNHEAPGPEVRPGFLKVLCDAGRTRLGASHADGLGHERPSPGAGALADGRELPPRGADVAGDGQPGLAALVRSRDRRHARELRTWRRAAQPPRAARMAERRIPPRRLAAQAADQADHDLVGLSSSVGARGEPPAMTRRTASLGRMPLKRLEADVIRDAMLAVSGRLDPTMGGPPVMTEAKLDGTVVIDNAKLPYPAAAGRRSVYLLTRHAFHPTLMAVFDQPVLATNCPERSRSAVPSQSLTLMNDGSCSSRRTGLPGECRGSRRLRPARASTRRTGWRSAGRRASPSGRGAANSLTTRPGSTPPPARTPAQGAGRPLSRPARDKRVLVHALTREARDVACSAVESSSASRDWGSGCSRWRTCVRVDGRLAHGGESAKAGPAPST